MGNMARCVKCGTWHYMNDPCFDWSPQPRDEFKESLKRWLSSVTVQNWLHEYANQCFQMAGMYDGAMSEECKRQCMADYHFALSLAELGRQPDKHERRDA